MTLTKTNGVKPGHSYAGTEHSNGPTWWQVVVIAGRVGGGLQQGGAPVDHVDPALVLQLLGASLQRLDEVLVCVGADHPGLQRDSRTVSQRGERPSPNTDAYQTPCKL